MHAFDICDGIDPSMVEYSQVNLWSHFLSCLKKKSISSFGCGDVLYKPKSFTCHLRIFCLCRLPDAGKDMVKCTTCHKWYHFTCVGIQLKPKVPGVWNCNINFVQTNTNNIHKDLFFFFGKNKKFNGEQTSANLMLINNQWECTCGS